MRKLWARVLRLLRVGSPGMAKVQVDLRGLQADQRARTCNERLQLHGACDHARWREQSAELGHEYVGTEHILLGLLKEQKWLRRARQSRREHAQLQIWRSPLSRAIRASHRSVCHTRRAPKSARLDAGRASSIIGT